MQIKSRESKKSGFVVRVFSGVLALAATCAQATDYYVATNGNDSAAGTIGAPFATIQKAANSMVSAGDTCYIRGGTYHEEVVSYRSGTAANPLTFTAYNNEVVTLDGTESLADLGSTGWTPHSGNIYKTTLTKDIWQLFDDGEMMIMARWPNAFLHDDSIWDQPGTWARGHDSSSSNGTMVDNVNNGHSLAGSGLDMTGAMGVMNVGSFRTWPRKVTSHSAGSSTFSYGTVPSYKSKWGYYYLECKLNLLDAAREWFYDTSTKTLYLWAPDGNMPSGNIRGKTHTYAFKAVFGHYTVLDGLNFFGTTFNFLYSKGCTVENCTLQYPSFSKRMLGVTSDIECGNMQSSGNVATGGTLRNCVFENSDGQAIRMSGANCLIENNYFHKIDFSCAGLPNLGNTVQIELGSQGGMIRRNTIDTAGASETIAPGKLATVEYNRITNIGLLQSDGAGIHRMVPEAPNSITRYNWIHDHDKYSIRFDGSPGGNQGLVHHNAVWNSDTMRLKGDQHQVYNNFGYGPVGNKGIINIATDQGGNANTVTRNNAADNISPATQTPAGGALPGTQSHNWNGAWTGTDIRNQVRDAENWDFRPKAGSALVDAGTVVSGITGGYLGTAPDIGAYEYGASSYWIAGRQEPAASTAIPPDGSTTVKTDADLMWLAGYQATSHDVYFGRNPVAVAAATPASPEFKGNQANNIYTPPAFSSASYFWRIDTVTAAGTVKGAVWSFAPSGAPADTDWNGMHDSWELAYFGSLGSANGAPGGHADSDLFDNYSEYVADTDPTSGTSYFAVSSTPTNAPGVVITLETKLDRIYAIEASDSIDPAVWSEISSQIPGTGSAIHLYDPASQPQRFYRGRVELP